MRTAMSWRLSGSLPYGEGTRSTLAWWHTGCWQAKSWRRLKMACLYSPTMSDRVRLLPVSENRTREKPGYPAPSQSPSKSKPPGRDHPWSSWFPLDPQLSQSAAREGWDEIWEGRFKRETELFVCLPLLKENCCTIICFLFFDNPIRREVFENF